MSRVIENKGVVETAISAVVDSYQSLRVENGYKNDVAQVYRHIIEESSIGEIDSPAIFVVRPEGATGRISWEDERAYSQILRLNVLGFIDSGGINAEDFALATIAEGFLSDIKSLAISDSQFGLGASGVIKNSKLVSDSNDAGWDTSSAIVGIGLELMVWFDGTNP